MKEEAMPLFYFHLRNGEELQEDTNGEDFGSLTAAREEAILSAREIMSERVASGKKPNGSRFEIADDTGRHVLTVPFQDAYATD
jgi:hypothetical protein